MRMPFLIFWISIFELLAVPPGSCAGEGSWGSSSPARPANTHNRFTHFRPRSQDPGSPSSLLPELSPAPRHLSETPALRLPAGRGVQDTPNQLLEYFLCSSPSRPPVPQTPCSPLGFGRVLFEASAMPSFPHPPVVRWGSSGL